MVFRLVGYSNGRKTGQRGRPPIDRILRDHEGNPLIFKEYIHRLSIEGKLEVPWEEPMNMDWRAGYVLRQEVHAYYQKAPSYAPRIGELVLFTLEDIPKSGMNFDSDDTYTFFDEDKRSTGHVPEWRVGVVTALNDAEKAPIRHENLYHQPKTEHGVNYTCFRVETYPDPSEPEDKELSKQHHYVPLHQMRPLNNFLDVLANTERDEWHPSIENGLTALSTYNLVDRITFKGTWPDIASAICNGLFIGSEQLRAGDAVRLVPQSMFPSTAYPQAVPRSKEDAHPITDVLAVENFRLEWFKPNANLADPEMGEHFRVVAVGKRFTVDPKRACASKPDALTRHELATYFNIPKMEKYGSWYFVEEPDNKVTVPFWQIVGRVLEPLALKIWWNKIELGFDLAGVLEGRYFARRVDTRIAHNRAWFAGNSRVECLDLMEVNGELTPFWDEHRDPKMWRANLTILDSADGQKISPQALHDARPWTDMARKIPDDMGRLVESAVDDSDEKKYDEDVEMRDSTKDRAPIPLSAATNLDAEMEEATSDDELEDEDPVSILKRFRS